ncbi:MAG: hypothetical protein LBF27_14195 [Sphingobacterium sp.]|jgi:hypothetical protein|nr:hypothetical protein [Sphingobacterium sp.]
MRNFAALISFCFFFLFACREKSKSNISEKKISEYPQIIDSLGLSKAYDEAKWRVYCYKCDDTLVFLNTLLDSNKIYFGSLDLKFDTVIVSNVQTEISFVFVYKGKVCDNDLIRNSGVRGVVYNKTLDSVIHYISGDDSWSISETCPDTSNCRSRIINPMQPEVLKFITEHKTELNPWFYKMAKEKGILGQ